MTEVSHVLVPNDDAFWVEVQDDYDAVVPDPENRPAPLLDEVGDLSAELDASGLFTDVEVRRYLWRVGYSADDYIDLLRTYSPNIALDPATATELFSRIRRRIEARDVPVVVKSYLATMNTARRSGIDADDTGYGMTDD